MNTIGDLPAHPLLVHAVVVLTPLTAVLTIMCAVWTAARERLVWLTLALSVVTLVLTPFAIEAGEALIHQLPKNPVLREHAELGDTATFFVVGLVVVSVLIAVLHRWGARLGDREKLARMVVAVLAVVIGLASIYQIVRIGHTGARAVWGGFSL